MWKTHYHLPNEPQLPSNPTRYETGVCTTESIATTPDKYLGFDLVFRHRLQEHFTTDYFAARAACCRRESLAKPTGIPSALTQWAQVMSDRKLIRFGPFELDLHCGELRENGTRLKLQGQPIQILEVLLNKPGELVSREEIRQHLWSGDTFVDFEHSLNTAIKKLRQALGDEAVEPKFIETLPKRGYRFVGEIEERPPLEAARASSPIESSPEPEWLPNSEGPQRGKKLRFRLSVILAATFAVLLTGILIRYLRPPRMPRVVATHRLTTTGYPKTSLVTDGRVLYFQEVRPTGTVAMQMNLSGGEPAEIPNFASGILRGVSPDRSEVLVWVSDPKTGIWEAWGQPLPAGPARLIVKNAVSPTWTADGPGIVFSGPDRRTLYRVNANGAGLRRLATFSDISGISVSPDGKRIRVASGHAISSYVFDLWELGADGSNPHIVGKDSAAAGSWSPDGKFYFFRLWDGEKSNLWAAAGENKWWWRAPNPTQLTYGPIHIVSPRGYMGSSVEFGSDNKRLFAIGTEPRGELSAYDSGTRSWVPYLSGISACYVDFSRDGQWVSYVSYPDGSLWRSRVDGRERMQLTRPPMAVLSPRWSPDDKLIAFTNFTTNSRGQGESGVYVMNRDGGGPLLLDADAGDSTWSPDASAIAFHTGNPPAEIRILNLSTGKSNTLAGTEGLFSPRWSPDGKYLVALTQGAPPQKLILISLSSGHQEELASGRLGWPSWSHDSQAVYFLCARKLCRVDLADHTKREIADLQNFPNTSFFFGAAGWFGLTPDDRPLSTRDTAIHEIYAFDLEY